MSAADFYKANVVTVVVPFGPGGTVDYAARLFANYWAEVTGGRMIVENKAGAGGLLGANNAYAAKPDGLTLGEGIPSVLIAPVLGRDPAVRYDLSKMIWIKYTNPEQYAFAISPKLSYGSMEEVSKSKGFKFGSAGGNGTLGPGLIIEWFGLQDAKIVLGYAGATEALLAVTKGEVDSHLTSSSTIRDYTDKGFVKKPLFILDFQRSPYFPDVPAVTELLKLSAGQETLLQTFGALKPGQAFWLQPGVPQDRVEFVRAAFDKIAANPAFVAQAKIRFPVYVEPTSGKDYAAEMAKTLAVATPDRFSELQKLADKYTR